MKNCPHTIIVLTLISVALVAFGCEQKANVTQDQPAVEQNAPAVQEQTQAVEVAPIETVKEAATVAEPAPAAGVADAASAGCG